MTIAETIRLRSKYKFKGKLVFDTAFRIGSGKMGESGSDQGVLLDPHGIPILPGSSLKGKFRSTLERLAYLLGLNACLLDVQVSGVKCVSDVSNSKKENINEEIKDLSCLERYQWLKGELKKKDYGIKQVCDICWLFGSCLSGGRIFFQDGDILQWNKVVEHRDGVVIDRDSERARDSLKYDFEVVPAQTAFDIQIEVENPSNIELALITIGLNEWQEGVRLGGGVSRGLGAARLQELKITKVDFQNPTSCLDYCLRRKMQDVDMECLHKILEEQLQLAVSK